MGKTLTNIYEIISHLLSYSGQEQSSGNQVIRQCLTELLNAHPDIDEIAKNIRPYGDDAILILVEALNLPGNKTFNLQPNAIHVLEKIGNAEAVSLILDNFNNYIDRFDFSLTEMLTAIMAREGGQIKGLIIERYIKFLTDEDNLSMTRRYNKEEKKVVAVLNSLNRMKILDDPRLPDILEKYVSQTREISDAHKLAQFALARADEKRAADYINENSKASPLPATGISRQQIRAVYNPMESDADQGFLTLFVKKEEEKKNFSGIFVNEEKNIPLEETPYLFQYERPLIYFLEDGTQEIRSKSLAGRAESQNDVINVATRYLEAKLAGNNLPETKLQECYKALVKHFNFEDWGFRQSFIQPKKYPEFIYDSEWCRIKFAFDSSGDQHDHSTHLHVYYGRLHAPGNDSFMIWNGEKCWCWHDIRNALNFLDGLSPEAAIKVQYKPKIIEQYRQSDLARELSNISPAEWMAGMESEIWKQYGQRLFELFDLRRPELWEQYVSFIQEFHKIKKSESFGYPAYDRIC